MLLKRRCKKSCGVFARSHMAAALPDELTYSADSGSITSGGLFTAGGAGTAAITVQGGGLSGTANVAVIAEPTAIKLKKEDAKSAFVSASVASESVTKLTALAYYYGAPLTAQDSCFTWTVTGDIGTVDAEGTFTAASVTKPTTGAVSVSCGSVSVSAAVTVSPKDPFADMKTHWAKEYVNSLYFAGVLAGSSDTGGQLLFRPDDSMPRSCAATSNAQRVRVEVFSKISATFLPSSVRCGMPAFFLAFSSIAVSMNS